MSNRHRSQAAPGATNPAPSKEERKAANRKARHRTNELLAHADVDVGEDLVPPRPVHTRVDVDKGPPPQSGDARPRREYRHWKQKFWKRRNNRRAEKALLVDQEMPLPDLG